MPAAPSMGVLAQLGVAAGGAGTATTALEFISENLAQAREVIRNEGLRGTRLHPVERLRQGRSTPGGDIILEPTYAELATLLPYLVAAASAQSGYTTYTVSDTVPVAFDVQVDRVAKVFTYGSCRTARATFRCAKGQPMQLTWGVEALTETVGNAGTFPSLTISGTPPFVFSDAVLTLGGSTIQVEEWEITLDWMLKTDRFMNSLTRTDLPSTDVMVSARFVVPYTSDTTGFYDPGVGGIAARMDLASGGAGQGATGSNLRFDMAKIVFPPQKSPAVQARDEILMTLAGQSYRSSTTSPLIVSLDSTP